MKHIALALCLATTPALAQTAPEESDGFSLMERGIDLFMKGLMDEAAPALDEMHKMLAELGPKFEALGPHIDQLVELVDDVRNYHPAEKLPNGDILIRRKTPEELLAEPPAEGAPEIEL